MSTISDQLIALYTAPNAKMNVTIDEAQKFSALMTQWGMAYDVLAAYPSTAQAQTMQVSQLIAYGVPTNVPLNIAGVNFEGNSEGTAYFIASEKLLLTEKGDAANGFADLYAERHPGTSIQDAMGAAEALPAVAAAVPSLLAQMQKAAGF